MLMIKKPKRSLRDWAKLLRFSEILQNVNVTTSFTRMAYLAGVAQATTILDLGQVS